MSFNQRIDRLRQFMLFIIPVEIDATGELIFRIRALLQCESQSIGVHGCTVFRVVETEFFLLF